MGACQSRRETEVLIRFPFCCSPCLAWRSPSGNGMRDLDSMLLLSPLNLFTGIPKRAGAIVFLTLHSRQAGCNSFEVRWKAGNSG